MSIFKLFRKKKVDELSITDKKDIKSTEGRASDSEKVDELSITDKKDIKSTEGKASDSEVDTVNSPNNSSDRIHTQKTERRSTYFYLINQPGGNRAVSGSFLWLNENRRSITVIGIPGEFDFSSDDFIFYLHMFDRQYLYLATFGNKKTAKEMMIFLDIMARAINIVLMHVERVYEGTPEFIEPENEGSAWGFYIDVKENEDDDPLIVDDFEIYMDDNSIVFLFGTEEELARNNAQYSFSCKCEEERILFGYDDNLRLKCIIIKNLTEIERQQVINKFKRQRISLEKKIPNKYFCDEYEYFIWQKKDKQKQASIVNYTGKADQLILPSELGDAAVVEIKKHVFAKNTKLKSIVIPDGIVYIEDLAFYGCESLMNIILPEYLTNIGERVFSGCKSLMKIKLPNGVTSIGKEAFQGCISLTDIEFPENLTSIGEGAFSGCGNLTDIILPNKITSIGREAFSLCGKLASIKLPEYLTSIEEKLFDGCYDLTAIRIPENVKRVERNAFLDCYSLEKIAIPVSVEMIDDEAFESCYSLEDIYYQGSEDEWNQIEISENAISSDVTVHFYSGLP